VQIQLEAGWGLTAGLDAMEKRKFSFIYWELRGTLTTLPPSVSRLSRENVGASTSHNTMDLHGLLQG
jgi:hypothetical protein